MRTKRQSYNKSNQIDEIKAIRCTENAKTRQWKIYKMFTWKTKHCLPGEQTNRRGTETITVNVESERIASDKPENPIFIDQLWIHSIEINPTNRDHK